MAAYPVWFPAAVLVDMEMSGLNDSAVEGKFVRSKFASVSVIAVTGLASPDARMQSRSADFHHQVTRPAHCPIVWTAIAFVVAGSLAVQKMAQTQV